MLRYASSFVIAAYEKVRLIPQDSRALPAAFLRSRPIFTTFKTFTRSFSSRYAAFSVSGSTFPGLNMLSGSKAALTFFMAAMSLALKMKDIP